MSRFPSRRRTLRGSLTKEGGPKYKVGDEIGDFIVIFYHGHSYINKRNLNKMAKAQHWYRCKCKCGLQESRSQQELIDPRRQQKCFACRDTNPTKPKHKE